MNVLVLESGGPTSRRRIERWIAGRQSFAFVNDAKLARQFVVQCPDLFSLVLLDAKTGYAKQCCDDLRRAGFWRSIVVYDGSPGEDALVDALEAGADDFLPIGCSNSETANRLLIRLRDADRLQSAPPRARVSGTKPRQQPFHAQIMAPALGSDLYRLTVSASAVEKDTEHRQCSNSSERGVARLTSAMAEEIRNQSRRPT